MIIESIIFLFLIGVVLYLWYMPYSAAQDLNGKHPVNTRNILVTTDGSYIFDGTGSQLVNLNITASNAISSSYEVLYETSSSYAETSSIANIATSASWASSSISSSYSLTTSTINVVVTSSNINYYVPFVLNTGSQLIYVDTSSIYYNPETGLLTTNNLSASSVTSSLFGTASWTNAAVSSISSSYASTSSRNISSSYSTTATQVLNIGRVFLQDDPSPFLTLKNASYDMTLNTQRLRYLDSALNQFLNISGIEDSYISSSFNLGLGTSTPTQKLHVIGNIQADNVTASLLLGTSSWASNSLTTSFVSASNVGGGLTQEVYFAGQTFTTMSFVKGILISVV